MNLIRLRANSNGGVGRLRGRPLSCPRYSAELRTCHIARVFWSGAGYAPLRFSFPCPRNNRGCGAPKGAPDFRVCALSLRRRASRRATAASSGSRAALLAAISLPEEPSDTALLGAVPFRASGKAKGFAPSASSSRQVLVPAGGDRHRPSSKDTLSSARGRRAADIGFPASALYGGSIIETSRDDALN